MAARPARSRAGTARSPGRHFLAPRIAAELVQAFRIGGEDIVVEVGAGTGRLTRELAKAAGVVLAIELDERLAAHLLRSASSWPNVFVHRGDAVTVGLPSAPFRVVGNIPFAITTALLRRITALAHATRLDLITQLEPARKRAQARGSVMSVVWGVGWRFDLRRRIPAAAFHPRPSVDAAWLVGERRADPLLDARDLPEFERFVRRGFRQASEPIQRTLDLARGAIESAGVDGRARAIDLSLHEWVALFQSTTRRRR